MDSFHIQNIKIEKVNAILRYNKLQKITALFRFIEFCVVLIVLSRFSTELPRAFKLSGEFFRGLTGFLFSPRFVFVLGNLIVLVLFLKSGRCSNQDGAGKETKIDLHDEFVEKIQKFHADVETRKEGKEDLVEESRVVGSSYKRRKIHRSQSENLKKEFLEDPVQRELRRSMTERCGRQNMGSGEKAAANSPRPEDKMSSEEFRQTVEAFIARQQRFLREEEEFSAIISVR